MRYKLPGGVRVIKLLLSFILIFNQLDGPLEVTLGSNGLSTSTTNNAHMAGQGEVNAPDGMNSHISTAQSLTSGPAISQESLSVGSAGVSSAFVGNPLVTGTYQNNILNQPAQQVVSLLQTQTALPVQVSQPVEQVLGGQSEQKNNNAQEDAIIQLDFSSFNDEIMHKNTANFVYFNANFDHCQNCDKFFNIWKELAADLRWWRRVVKLFAINCSDEDNIEICRRARVTQFPQVKYYWIMANSLDSSGQRVRILGKSVHAMRHLIMDKVLDSYMENVKSLNSQKKSFVAPISNPSSTTTTNPLAAIIGQLMMSPRNGLFQSLFNGANSAQLSLGTNSINKAPPSSDTSSSAAFMSALVGANGGGAQGLSQIMSLLMDLNARSIPDPLPSNWPKLEAMEVTDSQQLIKALPLDESKNLAALLIMETQEFLYTGLEVLLDLSPYSNQTSVVRVRDERSQLSKNLTKRDDIIAPALIYITPDGQSRLLMTAPKYTNDEDLRRAFVRAFERKHVKYPVKRYRPSNSAQINTSQSKKLSEEDQAILSKVHSVYLSDLTNAIRASLMDQVFRHSDLSDDQYNALVKYVYVLINYFPFESDGESLRFLKRLHSWLQNQVSPMDIGEYKKQFHDIDEVLPKREWVACKSLTSTKSIPSREAKKGSSLFENPAQIGKVVSNITRLLRSQQQQASQFKNIFSAFAQKLAPSQPLSTPNQALKTSSNGTAASRPALGDSNQNEQDDSPIERIIKSLTSGSLGSDFSILKLISTALTGAGAGAKSESNSKKFSREYPCGAWKLAHVMVVNEYVKDSPRKDVRHIVLHSLYQYMLHFYACPTCGNRVSDVSTEFRLNLNDHLQEQSDSIMLLWKVHNRISKRLENELRPGSPPKSQFPNEILCPKCRSGSGAGKQQTNSASSTSDMMFTPNWHEKQVLNFLVHHYRAQSLLSNANSSWDSPWTTSWVSSCSRNSPILLILDQWLMKLLMLMCCCCYLRLFARRLDMI